MRADSGKVIYFKDINKDTKLEDLPDYFLVY